MSKISRLLSVLLLLVVFLPASAQFKIGPRVGIEVNSLRFDKSVFDSDNRAGITAGVQAEFIVPLIGVGADLSVMYSHRSSKWIAAQGLQANKVSQDYIEIPLNLKYKLKLPALSNIIAPYFFTGPSFSILASKRVFDDLKARKCDVAWNVGLGVELIKHLQVGASYGIGMTTPFRYIGLIDGANIPKKNNYWTVTAAWLF